MKVFQYQIWNSNRSKRELSSKANFGYFLELDVSNFRLKLTRQTNQISKGVGQIRGKNLFSDTIIHKLLDTNSSFDVK